jgi:tRNA (guanosine-2'-O-)-methyltransferase
MDNTEKQIEFLKTFMLPSRVARIEEILDLRTRFLSVVLEDIYHPPNASAVIRTCECFGIQELHVIENKKEYNPNSDVVRGASKWIDIVQHNQQKNNTEDAIIKLKNRGYKIAVTTLHGEHLLSPEEVPLEHPVALCFGTEELGVSDTLLELADYRVKIPMYGFTESFNISVAAAVCLHSLSFRLRNRDVQYHLSDDEKKEVRLKWYKNSVKNSEQILKRMP